MTGDLAGAIADFTAAARADSTYNSAYVDRTVARGAKGDLAGALADGDTAIARDPSRWVRDHGTRTYFELPLALAELRRLESPAAPAPAPPATISAPSVLIRPTPSTLRSADPQDVAAIAPGTPRHQAAALPPATIGQHAPLHRHRLEPHPALHAAALAPPATIGNESALGRPPAVRSRKGHDRGKSLAG